MKTFETGCWSCLALIAVLLIAHVDSAKQKRQIFREQVLPALGGKIPEEAFRTDRLALNRLNKEGITVPDGVFLDARHVHKHTQHVQTVPEAIKVYLTPDGRYVPPEGQFQYNQAKTIDTTYVIRAPHTQTNSRKLSSNFASNKHRNFQKSQSYSNYKQIAPIIVPASPGIYTPIVTPLVLPGNTDLLDETYLPAWNVRYDWEAVYQPLDDYFVNNIALFNSHQIISDYQGFLNKFHERSSRHIQPYSAKSNRNNHPSIRKQEARNTGANSKATSYQNVQFDVDNTVSRYTNLTSIPETNFACNGRRGMIADVETYCQVFYDCSSWSRTATLCPAGTAFSETKKRCEWWSTVQCKRENQ
nr:uncharacterized protein LOC116427968 [Nomia melanderi]XP_031834813.1 uncharacterized protein LOC116427968 [Nomia melanderi]XP_031834815.1 uncharacterized protein LOC116427968 [Nomia melanderi]